MFAYFTQVLQRSWRMFLTVAKIMVPVLFIVHLADQLGLVHWIAQLLSPVMALLNLPPEAGIVWVTTLLTNIYGGIATLGALSDSLSLNTAQLSALGAMMLIAHNLPMEQAIAQRAGASALITGALRIGVAMLYGAIVTWSLSALSLLGEPVNLAWLSTEIPKENLGFIDSWGVWLIGTLRTLGMTALIISVLVVTLDLLERIGFTRLLAKVMTPLLRLSGLDQRVAPVTTVGVLLGLSYGGALIIEEAQKSNFDAKTRLLALSWLSLSHSLIEDTLLIAALGADVWIILAGRVVMTLLVMATMAWVLKRIQFGSTPVAPVS
ncbi:nucleoside recognition domain-containing protein [Paenalcaligenes hominis]